MCLTVASVDNGATAAEMHFSRVRFPNPLTSGNLYCIELVFALMAKRRQQRLLKVSFFTAMVRFISFSVSVTI